MAASFALCKNGHVFTLISCPKTAEVNIYNKKEAASYETAS